MSDPTSDDQSPVQGSRWHSENLADWENEGGSVLESLVSDCSNRDKSSDASRAGIALLDSLPIAILLTDLDGVISYVNPAGQALYAASASELIGTRWWQHIDLRDQAIIPAQWQEASGGPVPLVLDVRMIVSPDACIWVRCSIARPTLNLAAESRLHMIEDISTIKASEEAVERATEALSRERERARVTLECIGDAVISTDAEGRVTYLNAVAEELTGWSREAACGEVLSRVFRVLEMDTGLPVCNPANRAMDSLEIVQIPPNCVLFRPDGSELAIEDSAAPIIDAHGRLAGAVLIFRDRKMSRQSVAKLAHQARHDALTGLPNRTAFLEHFNQALHLARRHGNRVGLLFIDLDNFKQVNDGFGHKVGDRLLKSLSRSLSSCLRSTDLICRHGGDEFVVLLSEISRIEDAGRIAAKMQAASAGLSHVNGCPESMALSIGISLYPEDGASMKTLMHRADAAMYNAKLGGGNGYCFYRPGMKRVIPAAHPGNVETGNV